MTNLNLYRIFYNVAKEKNITKASEKLFISQPAVSSAIKELENELNEQLFERKNKGVKLTVFGEILWNQICEIIPKLEGINNISESFKLLNCGVLRIGFSSSNINQILLNYLIAFLKEHENIKLIMKRDTPQNLIKMLECDELDLIMTDEIKYQSDIFILLKTINIKYQLIGCQEYKKTYPQNNVKINNFPIKDLILPSKNNKSRKFIDEYFSKNNIELLPKYELDNYIMLYEFVKNGFGVAFVNAEYYKNQIDSKEVFVIFPDFIIPTRKILCLTKKDSTNIALKEFIKYII